MNPVPVKPRSSPAATVVAVSVRVGGSGGYGWEWAGWAPMRGAAARTAEAAVVAKAARHFDDAVIAFTLLKWNQATAWSDPEYGMCIDSAE
jgi:hypothetical protein